MINPIKTTTIQNFIALFDSAFGVNTAGYVHYIDSLHSLGFSLQTNMSNFYIGNTKFKTSDFGVENVECVFSKNKSCLYADIRTSANSNRFATYSILASKASNGKWNVFYTDQQGDSSNPASGDVYKMLYYNAPMLDSLTSDIAPSAGANGYPYIIHPCPDFSGGSLSDLFFIDHMPKFDSQNPPVITSGKSVFVIPPYPNRYANTAAFAIEIDPADY